MKLTIYGRQWCHLCEDMRLALLPLQEEFGFHLSVRDVDEEEPLAACYGERVPVLTAEDEAEEVELCHYHLDEVAVRRFLSLANAL